MGEIAEMMLEGDMCQWCGELLDGDGYPTVCIGCQHAYGVDAFGEPVKKKKRKAAGKISCPECGKYVSPAGLNQHMQAKHELSKEPKQ